MADLLNIGLSGINVSKTQLSITGHNITNVNTPGYTRQDATQATRTPQFSGAGYIGSGTTLVDVRRSYSEFLTSQVRSSTALASDATAYKAQIDQLDSLLAGSTTGITPSMQSFFSALQTAAEDPANIPARQLVLAEAEGLARRFNVIYDRLYEQNDFINKQMTAVTDQVNRLATSIGSLNDAIATAKANGKEPNDLLDARDEAVRELSTYIGVTVVPQDDASLNLFIGTGQPLVVGSAVARLEVTPGQKDPNRSEVMFVSGNSRQGITSQISGGEIGGLLRYRQDVLDPTLNSVGRLAMAITEQVNDQLAQGLDLKGNIGANLFKDINSADLVGQRSYPTGLQVNIDDTSHLTTSDYQVEFTSATEYRIKPVGGTWLESSPGNTSFIVGDEDVAGLGFHIANSGTIGTSYTVTPTRRGATGMASVLDQADQLAFAAPARAQSNLQNAGTAAIGQPDLITLGSDPDVKAALTDLPISLQLDAAGLLTASGGTLTRVDPSNNYAAATPPEHQQGQSNTYELALDDGTTLRFSIDGRPATGDSFTLAFNQSGVSDNRNALKLAELQNKQTVGVTTAGSGISFTDSYGDTVERVGTLTAQARLDSEATTSILKQATDNRDSLSAVNLDEEAANLIKFEQYYNASAQVIQVARSLFDTLLSTFR